MKSLSPNSPTHVPPLAGEGGSEDGLQTVRSHLMNIVLVTLAVLGGLALVTTFLRSRQFGWPYGVFVYYGLYLVLLGTALFGRRLPFRVRALVVTGSLLGFSATSLSTFGLAANGLLIMGNFCFLASLLFEVRWAAFSIVLSASILGVVGLGFASGTLTLPHDTAAFLTSPYSWLNTVLNFAVFVGVVMVCSARLQAEMRHRHKQLLKEIADRKEALHQQQKLAQVLRRRTRIAEVFLSTPDENIYPDVLEIVLETMQSEYGVCGYLDEVGALVLPSMTRNVWDVCEVKKKEYIFPRDEWGDSSWGCAIQDKTPVYSNQPSTRIPEGHVPIRRHISMPILYKGDVIGLILVANKETDYDPGDVETLQEIADQVAPILKARLLRDKSDRERDQAENRIKSSLAEKELLLQEVHHRVKNNMQVMSSLLRMQTARLKNEEAVRAMRDAENRISAMAMGHRLLYESKDLSKIDLKQFIQNLWSNTSQAYSVPGLAVRFSEDIPEPVSLSLDTVTPLGLVLNELISNVFKHAFPDNEGSVELSARRMEPDTLSIRLRDDGVGMPEGLDPACTETLGLTMVKRIVERQLSGAITSHFDHGTEVRIDIPLEN